MALTGELEATKLQLKHILNNAPLYNLLRTIRGDKYLLQRVISLRELSLQQPHLSTDNVDYFFIRILKIVLHPSFSETIEWIHSLYLIYDSMWLLPDALRFLETRVGETVEHCKLAFLNVFGFIPNYTCNAVLLKSQLSLSLRMVSTLLPGQGDFMWHPPKSWSRPVVYVNNFEGYLRSTLGSSMFRMLALREDQVAWWNIPLPPLTGYLADQLMVLLVQQAGYPKKEEMLSPPITNVDLHVSSAVIKLEDVEMPDVTQDVEFTADMDTVVMTESYIKEEVPLAPATRHSNKRKLEGDNSSYQPKCKYFKYDDEELVTSFTCTAKTQPINQSLSSKSENNVTSCNPESEQLNVVSSSSKFDQHEESVSPFTIDPILSPIPENNVTSCTPESQELDEVSFSSEFHQYEEYVSPFNNEPESHSPSFTSELQLPDDSEEETSTDSSGAYSQESDEDSFYDMVTSSCTTQCNNSKPCCMPASQFPDNSEEEILTASSGACSQTSDVSSPSDWEENTSSYNYSSDMEICNSPFTPPISKQDLEEDWCSLTPIASSTPKKLIPSCCGKLKQCVCNSTDEEEEPGTLERAREARRVRKQARRFKLHAPSCSQDSKGKCAEGKF